MELKKVIGQEAAKIDQLMREDIRALEADGYDPLLIEILDYALLSGGKRVRPLLVVLSARICGCDDDGVYRLATAFEYLHTATLIHDDVIDNAGERRGLASVFKKYGLEAAILTGDFLHAFSMERVSQCGGASALGIFCRATSGMVDGEYTQLRTAGNLDQSEEDYFSVIMGKTALLIGAACEIGTIYGGGDELGRKGLRTYGLNLGCAFQIVDDLLDYQGDPKRTGKAVGNDLAEGKVTLPLIYALQRADVTDRARLLSILSDEGLRQQQVAEVSSLIEKYHGFSDARLKAEEMGALAVRALPDVSDATIPPEQKVLVDLCTYVLNRDK